MGQGVACLAPSRQVIQKCPGALASSPASASSPEEELAKHGVVVPLGQHTCLPNGGDPQEAFGVGNEATTPTTQLIGYQGPTGADGKGSGRGSPSNSNGCPMWGP